MEVSNRFGVLDKTARTDLKTPTELGYLKRIAIHKKQSGYTKVISRGHSS
ncbi:hypothetical protein [Segatella albensis]|nr:hypothetical protein [Segatella albensis]